MIAGCKAKAATAYESALQHVRHAKELLGGSEAAWSQQPLVALEVQLEEASCLSLTGEHCSSSLLPKISLVKVWQPYCRAC